MLGSTSSHLDSSLISFDSSGGMFVREDNGVTAWADVGDTFAAGVVAGSDSIEDT